MSKKKTTNKNKIKILGVNLIAVILFMIVVFWGIQKWMYSYTGHGKSEEVPNLIGVRMDKAIDILEQGGYRFEIIDSVYRDSMKKMDIVEQDPLPGSFVKKGRKVYLIVNSLDKPKVQVPMLVNKSLSLAKVLIKNSGLKLGQVTTKKTTLGDNLVLAQMHRGDSIKANTMVFKGTAIDLIVSVKPDSDDLFDEDGNLIEAIEVDEFTED